MFDIVKRGFACGVFDLFHAGHVLMLQECKTQCDFLVVGVNKAERIDPIINPSKKLPIFSFQDRKLILEACRYAEWKF
jgi:glycerol-3-phosphate cytidylyltransferase